MKISLSQREIANLSASSAQDELIAKAVGGCKIGDWEARRTLERLFAPLIEMMAAKRNSTDTAACTELIKCGCEGLYLAAKRFPSRDPIRRFRTFAVDYIETAMDKPARGLFKLFG